LSRGADFALFVDQSAGACAIIRANVAALELGGAARIRRLDARKLGAAPGGGSFSLAFLDPPYGKGLVPPTLEVLHDGGWLGKNALVVIEERAGEDVELPENFVVRETRRFGVTQVVFACFN
ncbi:MAG: RsmD family RNA methyltransferase, partial [Beijerinckiaceae bacterium]